MLTTGIVASFSAFVANVIMLPEELEEPVYMVAGAATAEEPADAEEPAEDMAAMMASAEEAAGQAVAKKCNACHTFDNGGANKIGPNLWNLVNRQIASVDGYSYSSVLEDMADQQWTYDDLNAFLKSPKTYAPGTKMSFAGLKKMDDRANLILYLRSFSDSPAPLPQ